MTEVVGPHIAVMPDVHLGKGATAGSVGRWMSRAEAKRTFTLEDLENQTAGVECRKDTGVIDEIPVAYKDIDAVMAAQQSLVEPLFTLKQLMCVKG